jgi:L-asparagine oxygenase
VTSARIDTDPNREAHTAQVDLTGAERTALGALAEQLSRTAPGGVDHPRWLVAARRLSCHLPVRLLEAIRQYRHDPGGDGLLTVGNLPIDEDAVPPTPDVPDSAETSATIPAATAMLLGLQLGEVIAYRDEKRGALVQNVVPVRSLAGSQSNGGSVELSLHTENAFHPHRPDYVGMLCLRGGREEVGTLVSAVRHALPLLDESDVAVLRTARFVTSAPPSFRAGHRTDPHPVLTGGTADPNVRVDFHATSALDEAAAGALERLRGAMVAEGTAMVLRPGEMAFMDNRVLVHGRGAFTPRYDGRDRWLHRIFVHLDNRRTSDSRIDSGPVLI